MSPLRLALLALLVGCPKPAEPPPPALVPQAAVAVAPRAGTLTGGVYTDSTYPCSLRVPDGDPAVVGASDQPLRLTVTDPATGTRLELWATQGDDVPPLPRADCTWTFEDTARYRTLKVTDPVRVATCTPSDSGGPRVLAYLLTREHVTYQVAAVIPEGRLMAGKAAADAITGTLRFR